MKSNGIANISKKGIRVSGKETVLEDKLFFEDFAEKIINDEVSLFLGSGVSSSAGYPGWGALLAPCAKKLGISLTEDTDLYLLAQYYANTFGYNDLKKIINENINQLEHKSTLLDELLAINFRTIWTTNYDTIIENNLSDRKIKTNKIFDDKDLANISKLNRVNIYKLNGDISNLDKIIITQRDLEKYEKEHHLLMTFFKKELVSNTFLFLGYSFKDTLVLSCLSDINACLGESSNYHYTIMEDKKTPIFQRFIEDLEKRYHIRTLLVESNKDIPQVLKRLNNKIKQKKVFISGSFDVLPMDEDVFADQLCAELSHQLLENGYRICSGMGYKLGNYLSGHALEYLYSRNNVFDIERFLYMRPFSKHSSEEDKINYRTTLIDSSSVAVFIFGKARIHPKTNFSDGMWQEFEIAKKLNKKIIPIGCTGYQTFEIWSEIKEQIIYYPYLERYIDWLNIKYPVDRIAKIVMEIVKEVTQ